MKKGNYVNWEWQLATLDADGDRIDLDHAEENDVARFLPVGHSHELHLVRYYGNDLDGMIDRSYAEVIKNVLDAETDGGTPVPKRIHKAFRAALKTTRFMGLHQR